MTEPVDPNILKRAIDDRERRPWRYYRFEWDECQAFMDKLLARAEKAEAALSSLSPAPAPLKELDWSPFDKLRDRLALLKLAERGTDNGWIDDATVEKCRADVLKCARKLVQEVEAVSARKPEKDVCASCGHYRETHAENWNCDGWMPAPPTGKAPICPCREFKPYPPIGSPQPPTLEPLKELDALPTFSVKVYSDGLYGPGRTLLTVERDAVVKILAKVSSGQRVLIDSWTALGESELAEAAEKEMPTAMGVAAMRLHCARELSALQRLEVGSSQPPSEARK